MRANILYIMEISLIVMIILGLHYLGNRVAKILPLGKTQIYLVFLSLNRTFGLMPLGRLHLGNKRKTTFLFVFRSVCTTFDAVRLRYSRSEKLKFIWFFSYLIVPL